MIDNDDNSIDVTGESILGFDINTSKKRYTKRVKIGEGGQATVYKVFDTHVNMNKAMKFIHSQFSANKEFVKKYKSEVQITSQLNYQNIVKIYEADVEDDQLFIVMDYIDGTKLSEKKKLPQSIVALIGSRVTDALNYAHNAKISLDEHTHIRGVIHGDIKPDNLMINQDGEVMILDFGLAKAKTFINDQSSGKIFGTFAYAPPEQFDNEKTDERSDIYSLGVTLYRLLTGESGFDHETEISIIKKKMKNFSDIIDKEKIDPGFFKIISKATAQNREFRYDSAQDMKKDLDKFIETRFETRNASAKNLLGAFFNFHVEPQVKKIELPDPISINTIKKESEPEDEQFIPPKKPKPAPEKEKSEPQYVPPSSGKFGRYFKYIIILLILGALVFAGLKYGKNIFEGKEKDQQEIAKEQPKPQPKPKPKPKPQPQPKSSSKPTKETLTKISIKNQQRIDGDVYLGRNLIGSLNKRPYFNYETKLSGTKDIRIVADGRDDVIFSENLRGRSIDLKYDPATYTISIFNPLNIDAQLKINGNSYELDERDFDFYQRGNYSVMIEDKNGNYEKFSKIIEFNRDQDQKEVIEYSPLKLQKYRLKIVNPNNVFAVITMKGENFDLGTVFEKSYSDPEEFIVTITAENYTKKEYNIDFHEQEKIDITYEPTAKYATLIIKDCPANATIKIENEKIIPQREQGNLHVEKLELQKTYLLEITHPDYQKFEKEVTISGSENFVNFSAPTNKGKIRFDPTIPSNLMKNTEIYLDGKPIISATEIPDLQVGKHDLRVVFKLEKYIKPISREITIKPLNSDGSNVTIVPLNVDLVEINSSTPNTKIYVDNNYVGYAAITVPFMKTSMSVIKAETQSGIREEKTIYPKKTNKVVFSTCSPQADNLYIQAEEKIDIYREGEETSLLIEADQLIDQALAIDDKCSKLYSLKIFILTIYFEEALKDQGTSQANSYLKRIDNLMQQALQYLEDADKRAIVYKNVGKVHYKYSTKVHSQEQQVNYLISETLPLLEKFYSEYKNITNTASINYPALYDIDEGKYYLALCYQQIYLINNDRSYRIKADRYWRNFYFNDYSLGEGRVENNPFRKLKTERMKLLKK